MKKLLLLGLLIPLLSISQTRTVVSALRVFPKQDKIAEFEKALKNHAQKYHTGTWKWRVFTIESGPDAGGYHIVEGPSTWDEIDKRGDLGAEHMNDWMKNVAALTTEKGSSNYAVFREDLSTIQLTDYTDKIALSHVYPKPGRFLNVEENLKLAKKVWEAGNQTIAVYESSSSGPGQFILVTRYKQGLKERERDFRKPFKDRFITANGEAAYNKYLEDITNDVDNNWGELLFYNAELSSK
jgi:quinol monooxygenase YgiN